MTDNNYRQGIYGLVLNSSDQVLLVFKRNSKMWDFPGGGIDDGETMEQAIRREVLEELGISDIKILHISEITNKYDWPESEKEKNFNKKGIWKLGQEQHFAVLKYLGADSEIKLQDEELLELKWVDKENLKSHMGYPDQYDVAMKVLGELK